MIDIPPPVGQYRSPVHALVKARRPREEGALALRELEKLKSALVLAPPAGEYKFNIDSNEVARYVREPSISNLPVGLEITSVRDQIVIIIAGKLQFEDRSDRAPTASKLPEVVHGFVQMFRGQGIENYRAYGWNFDVTFDVPGDQPAATLIANTFLDTTVLKKRAQVNPSGAGIRVFFEHGQARCDLRLEPRQQDLNTPSIFAKINYHYELDPPTIPPDLNELRVSYHGLWGTFNDLLEKLVKP